MSEIRPIDANALKEELAKNITIWTFNVSYDGILESVSAKLVFNTVLKIIGNAPTVNAYTEEQVKELVDLNKKLSEERPEGEWIEVGDNQPYSKDKLYGCSKCRFGGYLLSDTKNVNFCPNCGTQIKGGTEE